MMDSIKLFTVLFTLVGCATSKLHVSVDIYGEEIISRATTADLENIGQNIEKTEKAILRSVNDKIELANSMAEFYIQLNSDPCDTTANSSIVSAVYIALDKYKEDLINSQDTILKASYEVKKSYSDYIEKLLDTRTEDTALVANSNIAYVDLSRKIFALSDAILQFELESARSDFEQTYFNSAFFSSALFDTIVSVDSSDCTIYTRYINNLEKVTADLIEKYNAVRNRQYEELSGAKEVFSAFRSGSNKNDFTRYLMDISKAITNTGSYSLPLQAEDALIDLLQANSLIYSQIYRLKDDADPIWREITKKDNEKKWHEFFSRTRFKAEGNSSVVVVRDGPGDFRVQNGSNDPRALIQGQLEITRSLINTAISVGLGFEGIESAEDLSQDVDAEQGVISQAEELTTREANSDLTLKQHLLDIKLLSDNLRVYKGQIQQASVDDLENIIANLNTAVNVYLNSNKYKAKVDGSSSR